MTLVSELAFFRPLLIRMVCHMDGQMQELTLADRLAFSTAVNALVVDTGPLGGLTLLRSFAASPPRVTALLGANALQRKEGCLASVACKELTT
jgi:hypothetical protein